MYLQNSKFCKILFSGVQQTCLETKEFCFIRGGWERLQQRIKHKKAKCGDKNFKVRIVDDILKKENYESHLSTNQQ